MLGPLQPLVDFIGFIVDSIKQLIGMTKMALDTFTALFALLPPAISVSAGVLITVCVLYKVLGRENQS